MGEAKRHVGIALIGHGFMGRAHANAWRQVGPFFGGPLVADLRVLCGRDRAGTETAAARFGWAGAETDWRAVVERADIDVVDICTPGDSHAEIAIAAAEAGKAVLCEKPLANSVAEAEAMLAAAERAGVVHMVCHNYRRVPAIGLARRLIVAGELGEIRHFRGTYLQDWLVDPAVPHAWRMQKVKAGSGALGDIASHVIDLARHLVGEIGEVSGMLRTFVAERPLPDGSGRAPVEVDDAALALLRFEEGAIGSVEGSRFCPGRKNWNRLEINGSRGSLVFDLERLNELEVYREEGPDSGFRRILATDPSHPWVDAWWPPGHVLGYEHSFTHTVHELLQAIARGGSGSPDFGDGLRNQKVLEAIERSAASRGWEVV